MSQVRYIRGVVGIPSKGILTCNGKTFTLVNKNGREVFNVPCEAIRKIVVPVSRLSMVVFIPGKRYAITFISLLDPKFFVEGNKYTLKQFWDVDDMGIGYNHAAEMALRKEGSLLKWENYFTSLNKDNLQPIQQMSTLRGVFIWVIAFIVVSFVMAVLFG